MRKLVLSLVIVLAVSGFGPAKQEVFQLNGTAQGTTYHITYYAPKQKVSKSEIDSIFSALDKSLSIYQANSLISKFNQSAAGLAIDQHLNAVTKRSLEIYRDSGGKFDLTVYPLVTAWGFGAEYVERPPDSTQIRALLSCVGSEKLTLQKCTLSKSEACVKIDVNGIAQGYSVDVLASFLQKKGIQSLLVEVGGEMRVKGKKPDGTLFKIGIEKPNADKQGPVVLQSAIALKKGAVTTSGNYRKYLSSGDKKYSHLIDPQSGFPISGAMISVTVVAPDAITADGYDNALMAMSVTEALDFVKRRKYLEAYFIYRLANGQIADTASVGFYKYMVE